MRLSSRQPLGGDVKLYRVNKVPKPGGVTLTKKDILSSSDKAAMQTAEDNEDCPVCDVLRDGKPIASVT